MTNTKRDKSTINQSKNNSVEELSKSFINELASHKINVKIDIKTWKSLDNLKKGKETFDDVIRSLLKERTISIEGKNVKALKYNRKTLFLETDYNYYKIGVEFEYNDVKGEQSNFTLDIKFKKIFYGKKIMNPSVFFGIESQHKHFFDAYLNIYLKCVALALKKEFNIHIIISVKDFESIASWRKLYYDYSLSEDSFINDIEEPLRLSVDEKPNKEMLMNIEKSPSYKLI